MRWFFALVFAALLQLFAGPALAQSGPGKTAWLGVLAHRGAASARAYWQPLADYLSATVPGWRFEIVPVSLISAEEQLAAQRLDFLITNPGHFVALAEGHPLSALATRERALGDGQAGLLTYGTVIFARAGAGLRTIGDLRGRTLAAVSPDAFGGFQLAWSEMTHHNVDPFTDLSALQFMGFPQDALVAAVASGEVDAGVVRSGLLESLAAEGRIALSDFEILNSRAQPDYPYRVTGQLYPEWPFVATAGADKRLREQVALALLRTQDPQLRRDYGLADAWSAPLPYARARQLVLAYQARVAPAPVRQGAAIGPGIAIAVALAGLLAGAAIWGRVSAAWRRRHAGPETQDPAPPTDPELAEARARFEALTPREREILCLICSGEPSKCIATKLGVSLKTVEFHRANLLKKTDAGTTARLVQMATRLGYDLGFSRGDFPA